MICAFQFYEWTKNIVSQRIQLVSLQWPSKKPPNYWHTKSRFSVWPHHQSGIHSIMTLHVFSFHTLFFVGDREKKLKLCSFHYLVESWVEYAMHFRKSVLHFLHPAVIYEYINIYEMNNNIGRVLFSITREEPGHLHCKQPTESEMLLSKSIFYYSIVQCQTWLRSNLNYSLQIVCHKMI